jgi:hypothetical protein
MANTGIFIPPGGVPVNDLNATYTGAPLAPGNYQWGLITASRWCGGQQYPAGFWNGEVGSAPAYPSGIIGLGTDYVDVFSGDHSRDGDVYSENYHADQMARAKGGQYLGGYWSGERLIYNDHMTISYVCIKNQKAKFDQALISELASIRPGFDARGYQWDYFDGPHGYYDRYNGLLFVAVHEWATLPGPNGTPARYKAALPWYPVTNTSQGQVLTVIGFS